jgi:lipid-binding SYLF domain-containing protein
VNNGCIVVSYTNGIYAGVSINVAQFRPNGKANNAFYCGPVLSQKKFSRGWLSKFLKAR